MAIARGAGTEIIRCAMFESIDNNVEKLIIGEQHHIYTVLSVIIRCVGLAGSEYGYLKMYGYDNHDGATAQPIHIARFQLQDGETFVWDTKFSFNGYEPVDYDGYPIVAADQNAMADQGSGVAQYLSCNSDSSNTKFDCTVTFLDQNNA